ncbi:hypothetical protein Ocin01_06845 [Orchesella cincta]|uniref:Uncharacterized protein n=1 Tax=Orchesella cincta TaxID=48709 RepID=A0A1D2N3I3_ORCCI|nr:hypothetical protein Ocin01_06845 [Orchesella cincta]
MIMMTMRMTKQY